MLLLAALSQYHGSFALALGGLRAHGTLPFLVRSIPPFNLQVGLYYGGWVALQACLNHLLPGKIATGLPTPGGQSLPYKVNGLACCITNLAIFITLAAAGVFRPSSITAHVGEFLFAASNYGFILSLAVTIKCYCMEPGVKDVRFTGSIVHEFLSGIELNPRLGKYWDVKLFQIGRVGMISWLLLDLSFAALQLERFGSITNPMIVVNALHALYILDFFIYEDWYLTTIDIAHDHFGFYLAWGSAVLVPALYTTQAHYLAYHPVEITCTHASILTLAGIISYIIFRTSNNQKFRFRQTNGKCVIWGAAPKTIPAAYRTVDGSLHRSMLLCSGWWGLVRHPNYIGDLLFSFCSCAACGFTHLLPWSYLIFMTVLLAHRSWRDDRRCSEKYGAQWMKYCEVVRWRLVPFVF
ncbi:sterol reductase/lamin B receptor [Aspergillus heteromorphus CBS 117.55]|uniref:7-dehydrocholesterol reductase n=1 Tax=Aspergillus heteromorphus CBS 117.55 TaxID=1448321 RepID=A0A317V0Y7_9EURO|nr:sterol reductase/lamin B receptor [Aspergillus heteromorphus CBS 117.55]PWY66738.1 sterol reductase/lamin B receptor [Aspergillus heteromorphus CBS 117.55]